MDDSELNRLADAFEACAKVADAKSGLHHDKSPLWVIANRTACIRFAAAFLRAATTPIIDDDCRGKPIPVDVKTFSCIIQRMETWPEPEQCREDRKRKAWRNDRIALIGCGLVTFILLFLIGPGVWFWWSLFVYGK